MGWYEIRVQGRLTERWASRFEGMTLTPGPDASTVIAGPVADQAALHGLLRALGDLGLPLLAVTDVKPDLRPAVRQIANTPRQDDTSRTGE
jgi:hypothetical protein